MNNLVSKEFNNGLFNVSILTDGNKVLFPAKECAELLGHTNPERAIRDHCISEGVTVLVTPSKGGKQGKNYITEGNLYRLIARSKLESALKFERWVFDEVLPSIRKNGAYMTAETIEKTLTDPDFIIRLATTLKEEMSKRKVAENLLEEAKPKVEFYNAIMSSEDTLKMAEVAKVLNFKSVGRNTLFQILRSNKVLRVSNEPYQKYVDKGFFKVSESVWTDNEYAEKITLVTVVTQKGMEFIRNLLLNNNFVENKGDK